MSPTQITPALAAAQLEDFIREASTVASGDPGFHHHTDLFDAGYLDSLTFVALTVYIEEHFGLPLTEADLFLPEFTTIHGMANLITNRAQ